MMTCPNCKKDLTDAQWLDQKPPTAELLADPGFIALVVCCYCMTVSRRSLVNPEELIGLDPGTIELIPSNVMDAIRRRQRWMYLKKAEAN